MNRSTSGKIKCYSVWIEGNSETNLPDRRLGAYVGEGFADACRRACNDRFGLEQTSSHFKVSRSGNPTFSGFKLYSGRRMQ